MYLLNDFKIFFEDSSSVLQDTTTIKKKDSVQINVSKETSNKAGKKDSQQTAKAPSENLIKAKQLDSASKAQTNKDTGSSIQFQTSQNNSNTLTDTSQTKKDTVAIAIIEPAVIITPKQEEKFPNFFFTEYSKDLSPRPKIQEADA